MQLTSLTAFSILATISAAISPAEIPTRTLEERATEICGQWDTVVTGTYTIYQDLWGEASATSGSQCTTYESLSGNTIAWSTSWTWAGGSNQVKSFANAVVTQSTGYEVSTISSIPSTWDWSYSGSNIVADVAYDIFTAATATGSSEYEIMIWLAALGGAGPISSTGSPVATPSIDGTTWNLFSGPNGATTVYSFVAQSEVTNFSGDLLAFLTYLAENQSFSTSQFVTSIGAGSEPFTGTDAVLTVSAYSVVFNLGGSTKTTTSSAVSKKTSSTSKSSAPVSTSTGTSPLYGQCGGIGWTGPTVCSSGTCTYGNPYYSQCIPS